MGVCAHEVCRLGFAARMPVDAEYGSNLGDETTLFCPQKKLQEIGDQILHTGQQQLEGFCSDVIEIGRKRSWGSLQPLRRLEARAHHVNAC